MPAPGAKATLVKAAADGRQWKSLDGLTAIARSISSKYSATTFEDDGAVGSAPSPRSSRPRTSSTTAERAALR